MQVADIANIVMPEAAHETVIERKEFLRRIFSRTADGLYRYILVRVGGNRHVADDLLQQSCCIAAGHHRVPIDEAACEAWLRGVAKNLIKQQWRYRQRRSRWLNVDDLPQGAKLAESLEMQPLPADCLTDDAVRHEMMLAITALPQTDQQLVFNFYFDGRLQQDLADELGVTAKAVEARLYRIRNRLRALLEHSEKEM